MAYVPKFEHDVFLSYAHIESEWVAAFQRALQKRLSQDLGWETDIWQDVHKLRVGAKWTDELSSAVEKAAAFLAILSPSYRQSDWCATERDRFMQRWQDAPDQASADGIYRLMKVVKTPWEQNRHLEFLKEYQHIPFFLLDKASGHCTEFHPDSKEFDAAVQELSQTLATLLRAMRRKREAVFIATPAEDLYPEWRGIQEQLVKEGYNVKGDFRLSDEYSDDFIRAEMTNDGNQVALQVHMLGAQYDPFVAHQIELAKPLGTRLVFWIKPNSGSTAVAPEQQQLIEQIRNQSGLPAGSRLFEDQNSTAMIRQVLRLLQPVQPLQRAGNGHASLYLLCDRTAPADFEFASQLERQISEREGFKVLLPPEPSEGFASAFEMHKRLLSTCDGVLLYRDQAPEPWLYSYARDLELAERMYQRPQMSSKGMLVNEPARWANLPPEINVIQRSPDFQLAQLEPVLKPLRELSHAA